MNTCVSGTCPEGYGYTSESCDELATSRISDDACMTVTNEVCGDVIQTTCSQYNFRVTDSDKVEHFTDPLRCGEHDTDTELSDSDICASRPKPARTVGLSTQLNVVTAKTVHCPQSSAVPVCKSMLAVMVHSHPWAAVYLGSKVSLRLRTSPSSKEHAHHFGLGTPRFTIMFIAVHSQAGSIRQADGRVSIT